MDKPKAGISKFVISSMSLFLVTITTIILGCRHEPLVPPDLPLSRRDYVWGIDTLPLGNGLQISMNSVWGSSASNVYVVGHAADLGPRSMFRFDGRRWTSTRFHSSEGGPIDFAVDLMDVFGFSQNDVWVVGSQKYYNASTGRFSDSSLILHFDGSVWSKAHIDKGAGLLSIWGATPNDLWTVGQKGTMYHFDGVQWMPSAIDTTIGITTVCGLAPSAVYAIGQKEIGNPQVLDSLKSLLLFYDGYSWAIKDSFSGSLVSFDSKFGYTKLAATTDGHLYSVGGSVFHKTGSGWAEILDTQRPIFGIFGTTSGNLFCVGSRDQIYHYNGMDWARFDRFENPSRSLRNVWCDTREVFVITVDQFNTYVYRGVLP